MKWIRMSASLIALAFAMLFGVGQFRAATCHFGAMTLLVNRGMIQATCLHGASHAGDATLIKVEPTSGSLLCLPSVFHGGNATVVELPHWATVFSTLLLTLLLGRTRCTKSKRRCDACGTALDGRESVFCPKCGFNVRGGADTRDAG